MNASVVTQAAPPDGCRQRVQASRIVQASPTLCHPNASEVAWPYWPLRQLPDLPGRIQQFVRSTRYCDGSADQKHCSRWKPIKCAVVRVGSRFTARRAGRDSRRSLAGTAAPCRPIVKDAGVRRRLPAGCLVRRDEALQRTRATLGTTQWATARAQQPVQCVGSPSKRRLAPGCFGRHRHRRQRDLRQRDGRSNPFPEIDHRRSTGLPPIVAISGSLTLVRDHLARNHRTSPERDLDRHPPPPAAANTKATRQ